MAARIVEENDPHGVVVFGSFTKRYGRGVVVVLGL